MRVGKNSAQNRAPDHPAHERWHDSCGGPIELDTFWGVVRGTLQPAEFESATKRSQTLPGSDNPKQNESAWSCKRPQ